MTLAFLFPIARCTPGQNVPKKDKQTNGERTTNAVVEKRERQSQNKVFMISFNSELISLKFSEVVHRTPSIYSKQLFGKRTMSGSFACLSLFFCRMKMSFSVPNWQDNISNLLLFPLCQMLIYCINKLPLWSKLFNKFSIVATHSAVSVAVSTTMHSQIVRLIWLTNQQLLIFRLSWSGEWQTIRGKQVVIVIDGGSKLFEIT